MSFRTQSLPLLALFSSSLALQALAGLDGKSGAATVTVKAYWLRHGFSCANVLQKQAIDNSFLKKPQTVAQGLTFGLYADPTLTDCAIARARALGPSIWKKINEGVRKGGDKERAGPGPKVFSSELVRAMETAIHNFPDAKVMPIPFIAEHGLTSDNRPIEWKHQQEKIARNNSGDYQVPQDPILWDPKVNGLNDREGSGTDKSNYKKFKRDFPDKLAALYPEAQDGDEISVVIVAHSGYMREHLTCDLRNDEEKRKKKDRPKPRNNEVWLQEYTTELPSQETLSSPSPQKRTKKMREVEASCRQLFADRDNFPEEPALTCEKDIRRCSESRRPTALLKKNKEACGIEDTCAADLLGKPRGVLNRGGQVIS